MNEKYEIHTGSLYSYTSSGAVGVLITENVMRKLARLQADHMEKVRRLLADSEGEVFSSMWTLHYPEGKQTMVRFIDKSASVSDRIKWATSPSGPEHCPLVFIASGMKEAGKMADAHFEETGVAA